MLFIYSEMDVCVRETHTEIKFLRGCNFARLVCSQKTLLDDYASVIDNDDKNKRKFSITSIFCIKV